MIADVPLHRSSSGIGGERSAVVRGGRDNSQSGVAKKLIPTFLKCSIAVGIGIAREADVSADAIIQIGKISFAAHVIGDDAASVPSPKASH